MPAKPEAALAHAEQHLRDTLDSLADITRVGGVSAEPAPNPEMRRSAERVAAWMKRAGLEQVEVLELDGVHPYIYGEWLHADGAPTVMLYAHHDVQPVGRLSHWHSPPFEPEERDGRLYGRGTVDDKAGIATHLAAIEAYLQSGGLPVNVKMIVDGEEEAGSENLATFLETYRSRFDADVIVLTDTANLEAGLPSITFALRGIVVVDVEVEAIERPLHSGMWGGPVPDAPLALCTILARLHGADGRIAIPGIYEQVRPLSEINRERLAQLPFDEAQLRSDTGVLEGVELAGEQGRHPYELMWYRPAVSISALEAAPLATASNQIVPSARARVGIRVVPDMDPRGTAEALCAFLAEDPPWNVKVTTQIQAVAKWWITNPEGAAFEAAEKALERGFGRSVAFIGCGGSIPFVEPFAEVLGGVPAILIGLEDPLCNAHSENESLLISDFVKATNSAIYLYDELSRLSVKR